MIFLKCHRLMIIMPDDVICLHNANNTRHLCLNKREWRRMDGKWYDDRGMLYPTSRLASKTESPYRRRNNDALQDWMDRVQSSGA